MSISLNFILGIVGVLLVIVGIAFIMAYVYQDSKISIIAKAIPLLGLVFLIFSQCFVIVGTGYTGVRITFGQVNETPVAQGFNFKIPFVQKIAKVNNKQQDLEVIDTKNSIESTIKGKIPIVINGITVTYQVSASKAAYIYTTVSNPENLLTNNVVSSAVKATTPNFDTDSVVVRSDVEAATKETLQNYINSKYGTDVLTVVQITIGDISFTEDYNNSVNEKNMAKQAAETQEIENKKNVDKATAEAEAKLIAAQAEKESNELLEESITNNILMQQYLDKWNGKLPTVAGSDGSVMIDISKFMDENQGTDEQ